MGKKTKKSRRRRPPIKPSRLSLVSQRLAQYPGPRVKLSGFYAATDPGYDYPHRAAWPYVEALAAAFGIERLLWCSDFSPSLQWLSFPQTFELFGKIPFLNEVDRQRIEDGNLLALLADAGA